jgi:hypothetical protein
MTFDTVLATFIVACIGAIGVIVAALIGLHNKGALSQITVNTDGRLSDLLTKINALEAKLITAEAVATAIAIETEKAASIASGGKP